jgi:hypothetical protein|tara:strand:+ start:1742 stop:2251 length:510 start_codon:yes stop_codon:yes gene_type:complete
MAKSTPLRKLAILGNILTVDYNSVLSFKKEYAEGNIALIESSWGDRFKNENPDMYNLPERLKIVGSKENSWRAEIWGTYKNRLRAVISVKGSKIYAKVTCENGELLDGRFNSKRWTAKFQIKAIHLNTFKSKIDYLFTQNAFRLYDEELSIQEKKRVEEIEKELLKQTS